MSDTEKVVAIQRVLGLTPFILIQFEGESDDPEELTLNIEFGGGITKEMLGELLGYASQELT